MRIIDDVNAARSTVLRRKPFEEAELSPMGKQRVRETFGEDLTADQVVDRIIAYVRQSGDEALRDLSLRIDGARIGSFEVSRDEIAAASAEVDEALLSALKTAAGRIRDFHLKQRVQGWVDFSEGALGQIVRPLARVGLYVPGGTAAYPSTVLMTAIPAKVAGVEEVVLTTPPKADGKVPASILVAADLAGVDRVFRLGGAQAVAALAYGTESVPRVDKILGPGNIFVVLAKRKVFGVVGIDALPGPTETLIIADDSADPALCAADMLAQAEHDPLASALLITTSRDFARLVDEEVERQLVDLPRREIARQSLDRQGAIVVAASIDEAIQLANEYGPEHLCLTVREGPSYLGKVRNAGGIFLGESSSEALGDYAAGPSHVMPTGGTARFSSPLNLADFVKVISLVAVNEEIMRRAGPAAAAIAKAEGLTAHARALEMRLAKAVSGKETQS
ncbi:MAG: histidinol dehydrogenase [Chloroflexi bacterium]|nr:histidinol dehydrogenase [Chloroflexota bacterium]